MCYFCENAIHIVMIDYETTVQVREWKIQCKLPPKTKRFCPLVLK